MEDYLDYIGYLASVIVLISLLMSSIKKLRWINLVGALMFGAYAFFVINNIPTGVMNVGIVLIDIYYLVKMYKSKEFFRVLPITEDKEFLNKFVEFYREDMQSYANLDEIDLEKSVVKFYVLRNMNTVGMFVCSAHDKTTLKVDLDYVIPQFRDFKMGKYIFESQKEYIKELGYNKFLVYTNNKSHVKYVKKMGFVQSNVDNLNAYTLSV